MQKVILRLAFFAVPLVAGVWAGCSSDDGGGGATGAVDSGPPETSTADTYVPPVDAAPEAAPKRDCAADLQADGIQKHLDCAGLYSDFATKTVAPENKPYVPSVSFWSDGAEKSRWLYLPPGAKIDISSFDEWKFPNGTKAYKEFRLGGKRIETRVFMKVKDAWRHTTYRWNDTETDAVRMDNGEKIPIAGKSVVYEVPNTGQCDACHMGRSEPLLGVEAVSLGLAGAQGVTLASLAAEGRFATTPPATLITIPDDGTTKAAAALGWLHANCGACHNANPNAGAQFTQQFFLLRPSQLVPDGGTPTVPDLDPWKTAVNVDSSRQDDAGVPYKRIAPGHPESSLASILSGRRVTGTDEPNPVYQMPPLVSRQVDTVGHAQLDAWITAITP